MFKELEVIGQSLSGPMQIALDRSLLAFVRRPTLRIYRWEEPYMRSATFQPHSLVAKYAFLRRTPLDDGELVITGRI